MIRAIRNISDRKRKRRLSRMKVMAAENERKHLARELHDEFLQFLVAFKIRGKLLVDETDREERERAWAAVADEILGAIRGVKRMIRGLRSAKLEEQGLVSALDSLFRDARKVHGVTVHASVNLERVADELDPVTALALYRIVQEAVTNAATYAEVSEAAVTLTLAGGMIIAEIRDEGCGFELSDPGAAPEEGHVGVGLAGMRERAELVGGSLTVQSSPGEGTTVRAAVPQPEISRSLTRALFERRVPHVLLIYGAAAWALVAFTAFMVDELLLSESWTTVAIAALGLQLPSVAVTAWFRGRPGRDEAPMARRFAIPANLAFTTIVLFLLFGDANLDARTTTATVEIRGETVERTVARPEFRQRTALSRFNAAPGLGPEVLWLTYMAPLALELDLAADDFFEPIPVSAFNERIADYGLQRGGDVPLPLRWAVAELLHATFIVSGTVDRTGDGYRVAMNIDNTDSGRRVSETAHEGPDFLALVDEMSETLAEALDLADRDGVEDLPVRQRLTEDEAALAAFGRAYATLLSDPSDLDAAIRELVAATDLDSTFAMAWYLLSATYLDDNRTEESVAAMQAAIEHLYRLPERLRLEVEADHYFLTEQPERGAAVIETWVALHPEDPVALDYHSLMQTMRGDWEGLTRTLETRYRLNPTNHSLLKSLAEAHEHVGDRDLALAALERYAGRMPADYTGHVDLARMHRRMGAPGIALEHLERAITVDPLNPNAVGELAALDLDLGRFDAALAGYERALELARTPRQRAAALDGLKAYYRFRGQMEDAIRTAEAWRAEASGGSHTPLQIVQHGFGDIAVYLDAGRYDDAADLFEELRSELGPIESDPFYVTHSKLRIALEAGETDAARSAYRAASDWIETWGADMVRPILTGDLGRIEEEDGEYALALRHYRDAMSREPALDLHRRTGRVLRKMGRLDEAEAELREVLRRVPSDPHAHLEMARVLEARGDTAGASGHLRSALAAWEPADASFEPARAARALLAKLES
ncbi:tetratricopeptide repeat protein [Candidatus Palauibacter sp.]|uniref:tetratricopeptide repeat protein n=1 Tax=Candidatus Palauibacter sp. TaxID=3101350 RepID=UPI003B01BEC5